MPVDLFDEEIIRRAARCSADFCRAAETEVPLLEVEPVGVIESACVPLALASVAGLDT